MDNYYSLLNEAAQRSREYQLQADAERLGKERHLNIDSRDVRSQSLYLGRLMSVFNRTRR
jgi:hypothetical protein